jgi:hypothetical protein
MNLDSVAMTDRMLAAIENPNAQIIDIPLGDCCCAATSLRYGEGSDARARRCHGVHFTLIV